ncbi:hypothetical protein JIN77_02610 [Verrucomicrobiaceae bacterium R5-34]|nr:hypothetical protein [Verrucomicrobiaceae bacterium R5-34]
MLGKFITHCEDSFTASVFTHLLHLPTEVFWQILRQACYSNQLPENAAELIDDESFWPSWNAENTTNSHRVIPDLFLRFRDFDLIIEAKRWDDGQQYRGQWEKELQSYQNVYRDDEKPVYLLALGGLHTTDHESLAYGDQKTCHVIKARWSTLLDAIRHLQKEHSASVYQSSQSMANQRICRHLIDLFAWHGFSTGLWFKDFLFDQHRLSTQNHAIQFQKSSS